MHCFFPKITFFSHLTFFSMHSYTDQAMLLGFQFLTDSRIILNDFRNFFCLIPFLPSVTFMKCLPSKAQMSRQQEISLLLAPFPVYVTLIGKPNLSKIYHVTSEKYIVSLFFLTYELRLFLTSIFILIAFQHKISNPERLVSTFFLILLF